MDAMWEARGSAFKVVEERWKTYEEGGEMITEKGERRVPDRELETLEKLWQLAGFIATETFGVDVDDELVLDIDDYGTETMRFNLTTEPEVAD
jgi:hypothetical protein